jgi:short-subunit dehydrogenase
LLCYVACYLGQHSQTLSANCELRQFGVPVVVVKPGHVATPIWQKARDTSTVELNQERFAAAMEVYRDMIVGVSGLPKFMLRCYLEEQLQHFAPAQYEHELC